MPLDWPIGLASNALLLLCRVGAALRLIPFLGGEPMPLIPWLSFSVAITYVLLPFSGSHATPEVTQLIALAVKEIFIGVVIGTVCRIGFLVLESIGRLAQYGAFHTSTSSGDRTLSLLYTMLGIGALLLMNGHHLFLRGLSATLKCLPLTVFPTAAFFDPHGIVSLFGSAMAFASLAALPIFAAALISDLMVASLSKFLSDPITSIGDALRAVCVQIAVVLSIGVAVRLALQLISSGMDKLRLCP
jgi:flagellar biosynthesis protein FliR